MVKKCLAGSPMGYRYESPTLCVSAFTYPIHKKNPIKFIMIGELFVGHFLKYLVALVATNETDDCKASHNTKNTRKQISTLAIFVFACKHCEICGLPFKKSTIKYCYNQRSLRILQKIWSSILRAFRFCREYVDGQFYKLVLVPLCRKSIQ